MTKMAFWAMINSKNEIVGTGFSADSAFSIAKIRNTSDEEIPYIEDIPKTGLMHTAAELNAGLEGTGFRLESITEDEYWGTENRNNNIEKNTLAYYAEQYLKDEMKGMDKKERGDYLNKIIRKIF